MKKHAHSVCTLAVASVLSLASFAHASEAAYRAAVAANWCNYLGPDCNPYGLSPRGYIVFRYLTSPEGMSLQHRGIASRELASVEAAVAAKDPVACAQVRDIAKAMRGSPSPDMKRRGRELFGLAGQKCD
mgnify:CR=1 FL=1